MLIMAFGSFDPLHDGHRDYFRQAKAAVGADGALVVVVARDASIRALKHREPRQEETERLAVVALETTVDEAVLGDPDDFLAVVEELQPDILFLGYDQETYSDEALRRELAMRGLKPEILRGMAHEPERLKSSKLHKR